MVHKNVSIPLVVQKTVVVDDTCLSAVFERPVGFEYEPGDWIDCNFLGGNPSGGITYSLSSSPTEPDLVITFKRGISPFKKRLQSLRPGDEMFISQYGNDYGFHLKDNRSSVLIAGGIGVAPFRSMLKEMSDTQNRNDVQLLYLGKDAAFIFADELNVWQKQYSNIKIQYLDTRALNRKKREKLLLGMIDKNAHHYFVAGPEGMVESTEHLLIDQMNINPRDIRIDSFGGY